MIFTKKNLSVPVPSLQIKQTLSFFIAPERLEADFQNSVQISNLFTSTCLLKKLKVGYPHVPIVSTVPIKCSLPIFSLKSLVKVL